MTYLGAALMAYNIYRYIRFSRDAGVREDLKQEARILNLPILLLVLFLCGYMAVGLIGKPDLIVASILLGGSMFVFVMLLLVQRITNRIQQSEHMRAEMEAAKKSSEAKTCFLSNMSHDLRTPLNAIIGYTTLAGREETSPQETKAYLRKIETAGHQLLDTINDVLEMSRIESGRLELEPERVVPGNSPFAGRGPGRSADGQQADHLHPGMGTRGDVGHVRPRPAQPRADEYAQQRLQVYPGGRPRHPGHAAGGENGRGRIL